MTSHGELRSVSRCMSRMAEPLYFGPEERACFGWLHSPVTPRVSVGVVICNPFGYEVECAHRTMRHIASMLGELGMPALRFDYDGTGNSVGDDRDPGRWEAWVQSTHLAVELLRAKTGVTRVCLLGIRVGSAIAMECAAQRDDIAGVVAFAPVVNGKAWLREIKALSGAMGHSTNLPDATPDAGELESVGIVLSRETQSSIARVDLGALPGAPAEHVLVIDRSDRTPDARWHQRLADMGVRVEQHTIAGFAEMMLDPHESVLPVEVLERIRSWLQTQLLPTALSCECVQATPAVQSMETGNGVSESCVFLDSDRRSFGIVSAPTLAPRPTRAILLLNSGAIHHVGHGRMYVRFARHWAARGVLVLRADLGGLGDSLPRDGRPENDVYSATAGDDISDMVAFLREHWDIEKVEAVGICSGGYHAFKAAAAGKALDGITVINPLTFFWKDGMSLAYPAYHVSKAAVQYRNSILRLEKWRKFLRGQVDLREVARFAVRRIATIVKGWLRNFARAIGRPFPEDIGVELEAVARRRVALRFVFATGDPGEDVLRIGAGNTLSRLSRKGRISLHRIHGPDHSFSASWMQSALLVTIERFIDIV